MGKLKTKILKKFNLLSPPQKEIFNYPISELYYWRPLDGSINFGDYLSKIVVSKVLANHGYLLDEETKKANRFLAIGSILHFAKDHDVVWGSGINGKIDPNKHKFNTLDVRAVRGPLTREFLMKRGIKVPEIYGDPALLIPHIFKGRFKPNPDKPFAIVPNLHDLEITQANNWDNVISPLFSWNRCIEEILKAEFVIASSLHGLIIAEAYGIPARYLRLSKTENLFKYNDYMKGTGRKEIEFATSLEEAKEMGGMEPIKFDHQKLLDAFPIDLWKA